MSEIKEGTRVRINNSYGPTNPGISDGSMEALRGKTGTVKGVPGYYIEVKLDDNHLKGFPWLFERRELDLV